MPIRRVKGGYKWGSHGHVYPTREGAEKQAEAAYAHGYRGDTLPNTNEFGRLDSERAIHECAGILIRCDSRYLLMRRVENGVWECAGGHIEAGESARETARRENLEETGVDIEPRSLVDVCYFQGIFFSMFIADACPGEITLNEEHDAWGWFGAGELPEDTHPCTREIIEGLNEFPTEIEVAKGIARGFLPSPQRFGAVWLFAVRITGTGISFRPDLKETVYRPPEYYLNDGFLERCAGLPLIFDHPEGKTLNSDEYRERSIGSVLYPFILGESVWGISRVYDDEAAELMMSTHTSTSPAVVFANRKNSKYVNVDSEQRLLLEGEPVLLDHLAICEAGVWDKGDAPSGILIGETTHERDR